MNLNEINTKIDELDNKSWDMDLVLEGSMTKLRKSSIMMFLVISTWK